MTASCSEDAPLRRAGGGSDDRGEGQRPERAREDRNPYGLIGRDSAFVAMDRVMRRPPRTTGSMALAALASVWAGDSKWGTSIHPSSVVEPQIFRSQPDQTRDRG